MPISWNHDETSIAYCAECIAPKTSSFFSQEKETGAMVGGQNSVGVGKNEEWGEALVGINPIMNIYIVHVRTGKVGCVQNGPNPCDRNGQDPSSHGFTLAQVQFAPDGKHIVYVGFDAGGGGYMPRRLGLIHCINRRSWIFCSKVEQLLHSLSEISNCDPESDVSDSEFHRISDHCWVAVSPRFSFHGSIPRLVYLGCPQMDTHGGNMALHIADWSGDDVHRITSRLLVDQVDFPTLNGPKVLGMGFPGIFCNQLPLQCFSPDGNYIYINSQWGSVAKIIRVSTIDGSVSCVRPEQDAASENLLFITRNGDAIISLSEPNIPAKLNFVPSKAWLDDGIMGAHPIPTIHVSSVASTSFSPLEKAQLIQDAGHRYTIISIDVPGTREGISDPLQSILLLPNVENSNDKKIPMIVVPHGGPRKLIIIVL
jgi:hypothetical protein